MVLLRVRYRFGDRVSNYPTQPYTKLVGIIIIIIIIIYYCRKFNNVSVYYKTKVHKKIQLVYTYKY